MGLFPRKGNCSLLTSGALRSDTLSPLPRTRPTYECNKAQFYMSLTLYKCPQLDDKYGHPALKDKSPSGFIENFLFSGAFLYFPYFLKGVSMAPTKNNTQKRQVLPSS